MDAKVAYGVWMCLIYSATPCIFSITGMTCTTIGSSNLTFILMVPLLKPVSSCFSYFDMYISSCLSYYDQCLMFKIHELYIC